MRCARRVVALALGVCVCICVALAAPRARAEKADDAAPKAPSDKDKEVESLRERARAAAAKEKYDEAVSLLEQALKLDHKPEILRELADVLSWAGRIDESVARYRELRALTPNDDTVLLAIGRVLSWSKKKEQVAEAVKVLDEYLSKHPNDDEALLLRARARTWSGMQKEGAADFRAYLAKHPDEKVQLELASNLSGSTDKQDLNAAIALYDAWLAKHPDDMEKKLQRARVKAWAGRTDEAVTELRAYLKAKPDDEEARLQLGTVLSWGKSQDDLDEALVIFEAHLKKHPDDRDIQKQRALVLLWSGDTDRAKVAFEELLAVTKDDPERADLELGLARVYAQSGRRLRAVEILDRLLSRRPDHAEARQLLARLEPYFRPRIEPKLLVYRDRGGIFVFASTLDATLPLTRKISVIADVGAWRLENPLEALWSGRANVGARYECGCTLEAEAAVGPRVYQYFPTWFGARAMFRYPLLPNVRVGGNWQYDDIYFDLFQPASISAGIRGHAVYGSAELTLPHRITVSGRLGSRFLAPDNSSLEASGTVMVPIVGPLSAGYVAQWMKWKYNDPAYWSPQGYASHQLAVRLTQLFLQGDLALEAQGAIGVAGERVERLPDSPYGLAFGGSAGVFWSPVPRFQLRASGQYGQTVRETVQIVAGGTSKAGTPPTTTRTSSTYWWSTAQISATLAF